MLVVLLFLFFQISEKNSRRIHEIKLMWPNAFYVEVAWVGNHVQQFMKSLYVIIIIR